MNIVGLLTDFGEKDNYVGVMKGVILNINPKVKLVDITHRISPGDCRQAAFLLYKTFSFFPKKTVFLVVVDPGVGSKRLALAVKTNNYYFIGPDNGVLSLAVESDGIKKIITLKNRKYFLKNISSTFHGRDIFAPVAGFISKGMSIDNLGEQIKTFKRLKLPSPEIKNKVLTGEVIYIDHFGNLVTNIKKELFFDFLKEKRFTAYLNRKKICNLYNFYAEAKNNEPFLVEGGFLLLEVSLRNSSAKKYFKAKIGSKLKVVKL